MEHKYKVYDKLNREMILPDTITFDGQGELLQMEWSGPSQCQLSVSMDLLKMADGSDRFIVHDNI